MKVRVPRFIKRIFAILFKPLIAVYHMLMKRVEKSIRLELIVTFGICMLSSMIIYGISSSYSRSHNRVANIDYSQSMYRISNESVGIVNEISQQKFSINDKQNIEKLITDRTQYSDYKIIIADLDGKVLYKSSNVSETQVDIYTLIKNVMELRQNAPASDEYRNSGSSNRKEFISFYPVNFSDGRAYVIVSGIPEGQIQYYNQGKSGLAYIEAVIFFILLFLYITKKKMVYIEQISNGLMEISRGNLHYRVKKMGEDELGLLALNINQMAEELQNKIERERKAEKTKNELITNVSHDLRTPLTSIMGYLGLIKDGKYENEEQLGEYVSIAYNKSEKLKGLIEDLFEYTKLTNEGISLYKQKVDIGEFLEQFIEELTPICEENDITIVKEIPAEKLIVDVDADKMLRVFENLIMNAIKYSYKPGEIKISLSKGDRNVMAVIENSGDEIPKEEIPMLFERFYRVEKSRSSSTGGSGLGLAIAKNIVELHGGKIWAECDGNVIRFLVKLKMK